MKIKAGNALLLSILAMALSCTQEEEETAGARPPLNVQAVKILPQPFNNDLVATAELLASEEVELKAPIAGTVLDISFKEGQQVTKGAALIRLDDRAWRAQLIGLKAELSNAEKDYKRKKALIEIEGSSQEEVDVAYTTVEKLRSQIEQLQVNIQLANVRAPFSGKLGMRDFSLGAYLKEGETITSITALSDLKVDFSIPQEYKNSVEMGQKIDVFYQGDTLQATIYAISPSINTNSRTLNVRARLSQPKGKNILPGAFAQVSLSTNFIEDALLVPSQAIVPEINDETVFVYEKGKAIRKKVVLGNRTATKVHIVKGISSGDTLITTGLLQVKDGANVNLQAVK